MEGRWSFLRRFSYTQPAPRLTWSHAIAFSAALKRFEVPLRDRVRSLVEKWDCALSEIGGDPLHERWENFRPLRLTREEDWSDWLAWLIETSSGAFPALLFGRDRPSSRVAVAEREVIVPQHRLDICVRWSNGDVSTLEVKVGDRDFEKTLSAADAHRRLRSGTGEDWILIPPDDWARCSLPGIRKMTWEDVAKVLRSCLRSSDETVSWKVWARGLTGCIERRLLNYPQFDAIGNMRDVSLLVAHLEGIDVG